MAGQHATQAPLTCKGALAARRSATGKQDFQSTEALTRNQRCNRSPRGSGKESGAWIVFTGLELCSGLCFANLGGELVVKEAAK